VAQATNEPNRGPDFSPGASDGLATATPETHRTTTATQSTTTATQPAPTLDPARDEREAIPPGTATANANAAAAPADRSSAPSTKPDNSKVNQRDQSSAALTPMDQGSSEADRKITQQIRQDLMKDKSLSFTAKNVKIITIDGKVTLRGPVKSDAERSAIEAAARRVTGNVDSQLEVSK